MKTGNGYVIEDNMIILFSPKFIKSIQPIIHIDHQYAFNEIRETLIDIKDNIILEFLDFPF